MTAKQLVEESSRRILRLDAESLLIHVVGRDRAWLLAHPDAHLLTEQVGRVRELVSRREAHEPLQYLTGRQEFFGLDLCVTEDVLIPRPETELLVEAVLGWVRRSERTEPSAGSRQRRLRLVDVGTGSGAIALALASAFSGAEVWAVDLSEKALAVARQNAARLGLGARVQFLQSDLLAVFAEGGKDWDVVVSNPPYVPVGDAAAMQAEVREFEPHLALFAGEDGLEVYRRLIPQAWQALRPGGLLAMEFGFGQADALTALLAGWSEVTLLEDYARIPRVALARRPEALG